MLFLTLRDLQFRWARTVLVVVLVGLVLTLLFLMTGLVNQLQREPHDTVEAIGAEHWIVSKGASGPFTAVSTLPMGVAAQFASEGASEIVVARGTLEDGDESTTEIVIMGHTVGALGQPLVAEGRPIDGPGQVVIADAAEVPIGAEVEVGNRDFTVVGLTPRSTVLAGLPLVFMELGDAQDLTYRSRDRVSVVLTDSTIQGYARGTTILDADEVADDTLGPIESALASIDLIRVLLWFVAAIVVGAVVYLGALERTRDVAVLKAVGASTASLAGGMAVGAVVVALAAALAVVGQALIQPVFPLTVLVPVAAYWQIPLLAALVAVVVSVFAVRRVARTDPVTAFGSGQ